jgi:hypothetical protein
LLAPSIESVEENACGAVLHLKPAASVDSLLGALRCHLAYEQRTGSTSRECPLDIQGLTAARGPGPSSISLVARDPNGGAALHAALRVLLGPQR